MISPKIQKALVIGSVIFLLAYLGYNLFTSPPDLSLEEGLDSPVTSSQDILVLIDKIKNVSFDTSIFTSDLFVGLVDFTVAVFPEAHGRANPFAPIGQDSPYSPTTIVQNSQ